MPEYTGVSIVDYLKSIGQPSDFTYRSTLATQKGISNYAGTAEQNTQLLNILRTAKTTSAVQEAPVVSAIGEPKPQSTPAYAGEKSSLGQWVSDDKGNWIQAGLPGMAGYKAPETPAPSPYTGVSIVDYLNSIGQASDYASRAKLAQQYGVTNYTGTAAQNTQLLNIMRGGAGGGAPPAGGGGAPVDTGAFKEITEEKKVVGTSEPAREKVVEEKIAVEEKTEEETKEIERLKRQQELKNLRVEMGLDPDTGLKITKPTTPTLMTDYEALRSEKGVTALEDQIRNINTTIGDVEEQLRADLYTEEGTLKPMELIDIKQQDIIRKRQETLDTLTRRKNSLVEELSTKETLINNLMSLKQTDYSNAVAAYNTAFSQQIQLINIVEGRLTREDQEANQEKDDARANLTLITNAITASGKTWDEIDTSLQTTINKLAAKSGIPSGVIQAFMSEKPDAEVLSTVTGTDAEGNQTVTFIYKDKDGMPGTVRVVKTGVVSAEKTKETNRQAEWTAVEKFVADNPRASYEKLEVEIRKNVKYLTDGDITSLLKAGEKAKTVKETTFLSDTDLKKIAYSLILNKKGTEDAVGVAKVGNFKAKVGTEMKDITLSTEQIKKLEEAIRNDDVAKKIAANPDKYKIDEKGVWLKKTLWKDELIYKY